jgi:hypothetical protein
LSDTLQLGIAIAAAGGSFALGLMAALRGLDALAGRVAYAARLRSLAPGLLVGTAAWSQAVNAAALQPGAPIDLAAAVIALAVSIAGASLAFAAFRRCKGVLRILAAGAILSAGLACCHAVLLAATGAEVDLGGPNFPAGAALMNALADAAFYVFGRWRGARGRLASATLIAGGLTFSTALGFAPSDARGLAVNVGLAAAQLAPIATQVIAVLLAAAYALDQRIGVRPATRVRASRGSLPPSRARRPAGTAWLRPRGVRSAEVPAAALARRGHTAR